MALQDVIKDIEGYQDIVREREILMKYGSDLMHLKGTTEKIIATLHPRQIRLTVSEVRPETSSAKTLRLVAREGILPPFQAGQYINLFADVGGIRTSRPYSISSSPDQTGYYDVTIRRVEDGFVSNYFLDEVKPGDEITTQALPEISTTTRSSMVTICFYCRRKRDPPFMSMIQDIADPGPDRKTRSSYYGSKDPQISFS